MFLSLILVLILSLIFTVVEGAIHSAAGMKTELIMDMGLDSVFAEYNRELLKKYDLYFIDSSYGASAPSLINTEEHLRSYIDYNCSPGKGWLFGAADFAGMKLDSLSITDVSYATDQVERVFKRQAIMAIKDIRGISALQTLVSKASADYSAYQASGYEEEDVEELEEELKEKLDGIDYKIPENPAADVFDEKPGMLNYLTDTASVSRRRIDVASLASHRSLQSGSGVRKPEKDPDSFINELMFDEYLMEKCSDYISHEGHEAIAYEIEYILQGENTDIANLRKVVAKLLGVRYAADAVYILSDSDRKETVKVIAEAIAALLTLPAEAGDAVAYLILLAWAYGESVSDVKRLMAGERVPLQKTDEDWKMPIWGLFSLKSTAKPTGEEGSGFSYNDYVRVFLLAMDKSKKVMRAMDVIEANIRRTEGNQRFRMDGCIEYLNAAAVFKSRRKHEFSIMRGQSYLESD